MDTVTAQGTGASGLATPAARWAMVFVWCCGVATGALNGHLTPPQPLLIAAYAVGLAGAFLLTDPHDRPLSGVRAWSIPAASLTITALVLTHLSEARAIWPLDFSAYLLALLIARGNTVLGLTGGIVQLTLVIGWAVSTEQPISGVVAMVTVPAGSYVLGLLWRGILRSIVRRERAHRSVAAEAERQIVAGEQAAATFQRELDEIRTRVRPLLSRLRDGAELDDETLTDVIVLEGAVRDGIRSPRLRHPLVDAAAAHARSRGVSVSLLADATDDRRVGDVAAQRLAELIDSAADGAIVVSTSARVPDAIGVVVNGAHGPRRWTVEDAQE